MLPCQYTVVFETARSVASKKGNPQRRRKAKFARRLMRTSEAHLSVSDKLCNPARDKGVAGDSHGLVVVGCVQDVREVAERNQNRSVQGLPKKKKKKGCYRVSERYPSMREGGL